MLKDLVSLQTLDKGVIEQILALAAKIKQRPEDYQKHLLGKSIGLLFQKPSTRTRISFEVGMFQLGGYATVLGPETVDFGKREDVRDLAKTLSTYLYGLVARTFDHKQIIRLAESASIPVINGLSDYSHPCQALSDVFTLKERLNRPWEEIQVAFIGDGNNVLHSLIHAAALLKFSIKVSTPKKYQPCEKVLAWARKREAPVEWIEKPKEAVKEVDAIYTDVWASMGQEGELKKRKKIFKNYQVNQTLLSFAKRDAVVMHCLPAHRGEEITDEVLDGERSIVFQQTENKLHVQKAILCLLIRGN